MFPRPCRATIPGQDCFLPSISAGVEGEGGTILGKNFAPEDARLEAQNDVIGVIGYCVDERSTLEKNPITETPNAGLWNFFLFFVFQTRYLRHNFSA